MKDWSICRTGRQSFWLTRIDVLPDGREILLCAGCDGPLEGHVAAFYESSHGAPGIVASSLCWRCNVMIGEYDLPAEMDVQIELLLAEGPAH